ncbi:MAG: MFS family permease [Halieaceae bacterium]|jgi:MFS family permease
MSVVIRSLFSVFLSITILLIGHGLQQSLLPLYAQSIGWSPAEIGLTGSAYFFGFIVGCFYVPKLIRNVGHVRVFAVCSGLAIVAILMTAKWQHVAIWAMCRALTGLSFAGLYMIFESWLNEQSPNHLRGSILSFYGFLSLVAMALGQFLLFDLEIGEGSALVAIILALAIIPVALTRSPQPQIPTEVSVSFSAAYRASQVAPVMAAVSGFVMGLIWSNGAVFASAHSSSIDAGASFILFTLIGGLVCQLPAGRLSDHHDRRWVMLGLSTTACICIAVVLSQGQLSDFSLNFLAFVLGGTAMPMYSLAIAHANDNAEGKFLAIASAMLVANGLGSTIAPLIYAGLNQAGYIDVYFVMIGIVYLLGVIWIVLRLSVHESLGEHYEPYQNIPKTTLGAADLDPRVSEHELE